MFKKGFCLLLFFSLLACTNRAPIEDTLTPDPRATPRFIAPVIVDLGFTPTPFVPTPTSTLVMADPWTPTPIPTATALPDLNRAWVLDVLSPEIIVVVLEGDPINLTYIVRLLGVEAPTGPWQLVGVEQLKTLLNGQVVRLVKDVRSVNEEGQLPRYVYQGGTLINQYLLAQGLVRLKLQNSDLRFAREFEVAARAAEAASLGLWGLDPTPTPTITIPSSSITQTSVISD